MADTKISALSAGTALAGTEEIPGVQSAATVKFTPAQIRTYVQGNMTAATIATGTITSSTPAVDVTQTWNSGATVFTGIKLNVTNTASNSSSLLQDWQVGGTSVANMSVGGMMSVRTGGYNSPGLRFGTSGTNGIYYSGGFLFQIGASGVLALTSSSLELKGTTLGFGASGGGNDGLLSRVGAGVIGVRGASTSAGGALNFLEQTAPSAPASNQVVLYAEDNGSGKTRLMALFPTGAAQQVAIEP